MSRATAPTAISHRPGPLAGLTRHRWPLALAGLLACAAACRFWQLTYHSLWFDESMSVFWAHKSAGEILRVGLQLVQDKHPPAYYLLLHYWIALFGDGPLAVRSLSALFGALLAPILALFGEQIASRRAGLIAGLLGALSPMLIWYSQETRMFLPATVFGAAGTLCLVLALRRRKLGYWAGYLLCMLPGLYSYLFLAFLLPAQGLLALGWLALDGRRAWRRLPEVLAAFALLAALFAPLALQALRVGGAEAQAGRPFAELLPTLWRLLLAYTLRQVAWPAAWQIGVGAAAGLLLALGLILAPARGRLALGLWLLVPLLAGNAMLLVDGTVFAETRYFLFLAPALCLAWGCAIDALSWRWPAAGLGTLAACLLVLALALPALWTPQNRREEWRASADYLSAHAGPNDAVLIHPDFVHVAFEYYYRGPLPRFYPFHGEVTAMEQIDPPLQGLLAYPAVWLVSSHDAQPDPQGLVRRWLEDRFPLITELYPAGVSVRGYATHYRLERLPDEATPADWTLADGLRLAGYRLTNTSLAAGDTLYHPPSNWIPVTLYWTSDAPLSQDLGISLRLVDAAGQVWGDRLVRPNDTLSRYPSSQWLAGEIVRHDFDVNLNPLTPAGRYRLELRVLLPDGQGWPAPASAAPSNPIILSEIEITPP